jgi:hypothetical protein
MEGEVVAIGPGARNEQGQIVTIDVKAGDRILFGKWSGTEVKLDGEELLIMKESDIMGILEGRPASRKRRHDWAATLNSGRAWGHGLHGLLKARSHSWRDWRSSPRLHPRPQRDAYRLGTRPATTDDGGFSQ